MLQCRQGGEGDETAKGHWPAPEGELAGTAFSAAQPVGAVPVRSVPTGRNGSGQLYGPAAQPGRRVGELPGALSNRLRSVWLSATPAAFSASASRCCWPSACSVRCCLARQNGGRSFSKRPPAPLCDPCCQHRCVMEGTFSRKGLVNGLLVGLGCRPVDFMGSSAAFWVLIFTYLWRNNGYEMLLWLAGLETIPRPLYEAAAVDGATPFQTFVFITLPNLLPTVVLTTIRAWSTPLRSFGRPTWWQATTRRKAYICCSTSSTTGSCRWTSASCLPPPCCWRWGLAASCIYCITFGVVGRNEKKEPLLPVLILGMLAFTVLWPLWFTVDGALMASDELTAALGAGPVGHSRRRVCGVDDPAFLADAPTAGGAAAGHPAVFFGLLEHLPAGLCTDRRSAGGRRPPHRGRLPSCALRAGVSCCSGTLR